MALEFSPSALRELRRGARLSRTGLAAAIGRTHPMIERYEQGRNAPPPEVAERIAEALGCDIGSLYVDVPEPAAPVDAEWQPGEDAAAGGRLASLLFDGAP